MSAFFNTLAANFSFPFDLLDILVVAFIIYEIIQLVRQTRTAQLAKGILVLLIAWAAAMILNMRTLNWIINGIMSFGLVAIVVVFQPELRRALEQVGRANFMGIELFRSKKNARRCSCRLEKCGGCGVRRGGAFERYVHRRADCV